MDTSNHSSNHPHRVYWLTPAGKRLAAYLDYCHTLPTLAWDLAFADVPEHHDHDREQPQRKDVTPHVDAPEEFDHEDDTYDDNAIPDLPLNGGDDIDDDDGYDDSEDDDPEED